MEECVRFGLRSDHDFSLEYAQEKSDIQKSWNDDRMPMKLRMLGEKVYGYAPGVAPGGRDSMLQAMMGMEDGSQPGVMSHFDMGGMFRR